MSSLTQIIQVSTTGLEAATAAMQTISNNTANATTPGYNVESVSQIELAGISGSPGQGTEITSIQRAFNEFVYQEVLHATSAAQSAQVVSNTSQLLNTLFPVASGGAGGLGDAIDSFFAAANTLAQDPSSLPERQNLLSLAQTLAAEFQTTSNQIAADITSVNQQLSASVQQVNSLTQQIAELNQQIMAQPAGAASNALLDQRDQLVQQLSSQLGVTVLQQANGSIDIYTTSGAALVTGANSFQLSVSSGPYADGSVSIVYAPSGQDLTGSLSGGTIGGLLTSQSQLISTQDSVGALAASFASAVNTQQSLGLDLNGNLGQPLFSYSGPQVYAATANQGTGSLTAAITDPTNFTAGDFVITKTATGFEATNTATGQTADLGNGPILTLDGMTITVSGNVQTGDSFKLEPTGASGSTLTVTTADPAAIAAASPYVVTPGTISSAGSITDNNLGNEQVGVGSPTASGSLPAGTAVVPASAFGRPLSIVFTSATDFSVQDSSGAVLASGSISANSGAEIAIAYTSPPAPAGEVVTVNLSSGTAAAGDTFTLTPGGAGSNGNITALGGLANQPLLSGQTLDSAYASLVTTVGDYGQQAQVAASAAQGLLTQAQQTQQSISGVNLDQEAANLVVYQEAYQASSQVIAVAQSLFQSLLNAL